MTKKNNICLFKVGDEMEKVKTDFQICTLLNTLKECTTRKNPMNLKELGEAIAEKNNKSKPVDRRTVVKYIDTLKQLGFDIQKTVGGYYFSKRFLDRSEVKLLCDQITFSSIIPAYRKEKIIEGLLSDFSAKDKKSVYSNISTDYKAPYTELLYQDTLKNVREIMDAIESDKMITFRYGDYNEHKKLSFKRKMYKVSPYEFVYEQGKYYIMCQSEEDEGTEVTRNYRIDLMREIKKTTTDRYELPVIENLTDYYVKQMNMYGSDNKKIVLDVNALGLRGLYDRLGLDQNIEVKRKNKNTYRVKFVASLAGTKYFVLQYIDQMKVISPVSLKEEVVKSLKDALRKHVE